MNYTVDYLPDKKIVQVKIKGRINFQTAEQYSREAVKLARQNDCAKFLVDHSNTTMHGEIKKFHTDGDELQQFGFTNTDQIAIVLSDTHNNSNLPETLSQNSRWCSVKYFYVKNLKDAFDWLQKIKNSKSAS